MVDLAPILEIMDDQAFVALRLKADRDILLWPDLEADALPKNCTKEETWKLVTAVRKQTASVLPWHSYLDIGYEAPAWYSVTRSMSLALADIDKRYANGSSTHQAICEHAGANRLLNLQCEDLLHALECDGVSCRKSETFEALANQTNNDQGDDATIARNVARILSDETALARRRITPGFIENLCDSLCDGLEKLPCAAKTRPYHPAEQSEYFQADKALSMIRVLASDDYPDPLMHPLLRIASIRWFLLDFQPLPALNATVEVVLRWILLSKWELSALRFVPYNVLERKWQKNELAFNGRTYSEVYETTLIDCGYGLDTTPAFCSFVMLYANGAKHLAERLKELDAERDQINLAFSENPFFNHRQISIIGNALESPSIGQRIEGHRTRFRVSYATARADFISLERLGYLQKKKDDKAFVFYPTEKLLAAKPK